METPNSPAIDIFAENPDCTPQYMLAVMEAAIWHGMPVQLLSCPSGRQLTWINDLNPDWQWMSGYVIRRFRINPSARAQRQKVLDGQKATQFAPGHNPDSLTVSQVGHKWRLLERDEIKERQWVYAQIEKWRQCAWSCPQAGEDPHSTYRTRLSCAELAALDNPKTVPLTEADLPGVFWVRTSCSPRMYLPSSVQFDGLSIKDGPLLTWATLSYGNWSWSFDRRTWYPFSKEV